MTKREFIEAVLESMDWYVCGQIGLEHFVEGLANRLAEYDSEIRAEIRADYERTVTNG